MPDLSEAGKGGLLLLARLLQAQLGTAVPDIDGSVTDSAGRQTSHKSVHKTRKISLLQSIRDLTKPTPLLTDPATGTYDPFPGYPYTGPLRPAYPLSPRRTLPPGIRRPDYAEDGIPRSEQTVSRPARKIAILNAKEIEGMRKVCRLAREVLDIAAAAARPGITTDEIDDIVHRACIERNVYSPLALRIEPC
jgi:methionyl aminopeptidase